MQSGGRTALEKSPQALQNELNFRKRKRPPSCLFVTKCKLCDKDNEQNELRNVRIWSDKLLVLLASLNRKDLDVEQIKVLCASRTVFYVCCTHLINTCNELYTMLDVKTPFEIPNSDKQLVQKAMETVKSFRTGLECLPIISDWHFLQMCYSFLVKHWHDAAKVPLPVNGKLKNIYPVRPTEISKLAYRCRICDDLCIPETAKHVRNRMERLMVLILALSKDLITLDVAKHLFSLSSILTCREHVPEAVKHLVTTLNVSSPSVIPKAALGEVDKVLEVIKKITGDDKTTMELFFQQSMIVSLHYWTEIAKNPVLEPEIDEDVELFDSREIKVEHEEVVETMEADERKENSVKKSAAHFPLVEESSLPKCRICEKCCNSIQFVTLGADKLLLLLVSIHRGQISKPTAQHLYTAPTLSVCNQHFVDSCRDLSRMLGVSQPTIEPVVFPLPGAKKELRKTMELANSLRIGFFPLTEGSFVDLCRQFWDKFRLVTSGRKTVQSCRLCGTRRRESEVRSVTVLSEKMIVLVTEVARGGITKNLARAFFSERCELLICQWHLVDVCKKLCTMFRIPRPEVFMHPKKHLVDNAMDLVDHIQKGRFPFSTTDGKHLVQQCQRFTNKYWKLTDKDFADKHFGVVADK